MKKILIIVLIILTSCSTDDNRLRINGIVLNYDTKEPEIGKKIYIELGDEIDVLNGYELTNLKKDSVISDKYGHFKFTIDPEGRTFYRIKMPNGYIRANEPPVIATALDSKLFVTDTLLIAKSAGLRLHIKNNNSSDGDTFKVLINYQNPYEAGLPLIYYSTAWIFDMNPNDFTTTNQFIFDINQEIIIDFAVTRGEETIQTYYKVNLIEQEIVDYLIEY